MSEPHVYDEMSFEGPNGTWKTWRENGIGRQADAPGPVIHEPNGPDKLVVQKPNDGEKLELALFISPQEGFRAQLEIFAGPELAEKIIQAYRDLAEWLREPNS